MSIPVPLAELAAAMRRYRFAYLLTVSESASVHAVAVSPVAGTDRVRVDQLGRRTLTNVADRPQVTLLWPPADPTDYSLIVDGTAQLDGEVLLIEPSRAVLHRAAPPAGPGAMDASEGDAAEAACVSDCVEVPLSTTTA